VHQLVNKSNFDNIKMHGTNVEKKVNIFFNHYCCWVNAIHKIYWSSYISRHNTDILHYFITFSNIYEYVLDCRSQWPRGIRRRSAAARLLRLWVRIPPVAWTFVCFVCVVCVVRYRSLRRAVHSSRGVLPTVMRRCVWSRNLVNEEAMAQWGLLRQKQINIF